MNIVIRYENFVFKTKNYSYQFCMSDKKTLHIITANYNQTWPTIVNRKYMVWKVNKRLVLCFCPCLWKLVHLHSE